MFRNLALSALALSAIPFILAGVGQECQPPPTRTIIVSGATAGYLSPCGCTKPMSGGIRRRATLIQQLSTENDLVIEVGPFAGELGRQSEIKAETLAEALRVMQTDVVTLHPRDRRLGAGVIDSVARLSQAQLIDSTQTFEDSNTLLTADTSAQNLADSQFIAGTFNRKTTTKLKIFVTQFDRTVARAIAEQNPSINLVIYSSQSQPQGLAEQIGRTWLVTSGDQGKYVLAIPFTGDQLEAPAVFSLGPEVADDPAVSRYYKQYLDRLRSEKLVERMPKPSEEEFVGSKACQSCHTEDYEIWTNSAHSKAWATLKADGHDADPDCVGCHTVGVDSKNGFIVEEKTPHLTDVGCESCHGPGKRHVEAPEKAPMPTVGKASCMPCHNLSHSPNFDFESYWQRIEHGFSGKN